MVIGPPFTACMIFVGKPIISTNKSLAKDADKQSKISEFLQDMRELGIGDPTPAPGPAPMPEATPSPQNSIGATPSTKPDSVPSSKSDSVLSIKPNSIPSTKSDSIPSTKMDSIPSTKMDSIPGTSEAATGEGQQEGCGLSAVEKRLVSEWVPLGLNFGIPLFDEQANKTVCEKVRRCFLAFCS